MNLLYTCDNNYVWLMGISAISVFENNKHVKELKVYLLGQDITDSNKQILCEIAAKYDRQIIVIDVPKLDIKDILVSERWPISAFTRLFSAQLLPLDIEKVLYLDCDTIIVGDIESLDKYDLSEKIFFGVKDCVGGLYKKNIGLEKNDSYINAGVLLINISKLRTVEVKSVIGEYINNYAKRINYADQDILNGAFKKYVGVIEPEYNIMTIDVAHTYSQIMKLRKPTNFYTKDELERAIEEPVIIHYTTNMRVIRPWFANTDHPLSHEFNKYMLLSPWKDKKLGLMVFKTKEAKIIRIINKIFVEKISLMILGTIHAIIKPLFIRIKSW